MNEYKCRQSVLIIAFWIANLVSWEVNHSQSTINKAVRHWVLQNKEYFGCIAQKNQSTAVLSCSSSTWWGKITWNWLERWRKHVRERERERGRKKGESSRDSELVPISWTASDVHLLLSLRRHRTSVTRAHTQMHKRLSFICADVYSILCSSVSGYLAAQTPLVSEIYRKHR